MFPDITLRNSTNKGYEHLTVYIHDDINNHVYIDPKDVDKDCILLKTNTLDIRELLPFLYKCGDEVYRVGYSARDFTMCLPVNTKYNPVEGFAEYDIDRVLNKPIDISFLEDGALHRGDCNIKYQIKP